MELTGKGTLILISCSTGCTCYNNENHYRGPYKSREDAERRKAYYLSKDSKYWPLASQFARRGRYSIAEMSFEVISDDRVILDEHEVCSLAEIGDFVEVLEDGTIANNEVERFHAYPY